MGKGGRMYRIPMLTVVAECPECGSRAAVVDVTPSCGLVVSCEECGVTSVCQNLASDTDGGLSKDEANRMKDRMVFGSSGTESEDPSQRSTEATVDTTFEVVLALVEDHDGIRAALERIEEALLNRRGCCAKGLPTSVESEQMSDGGKPQADYGKQNDSAIYGQRTGNSLPDPLAPLGCRACESFRTDTSRGGVGVCFASIIETTDGHPVYRMVRKTDQACGKFRAK